jgi:hypothetical protein
MWIMMKDAFYSIVFKDCEADQLLVRARRRGDIEKLFPEAEVTRSSATDYLYRAAIKKTDLALAVATELNTITYSNFKNSVQDQNLHDAYLNVWLAMAELQSRPHRGHDISSAAL